jgi:hypothetical protein
MQEPMQTWTAIIIVLLAAGLVARHYLRLWRGEGVGCGTCHRCSKERSLVTLIPMESPRSNAARRRTLDDGT